MSYTWVEPFAGAAAVALRLVGGLDLTPPVAWMGGKRRYARAIADAMGVPRGRPSRVALCDAGPWGWVWPLLLDAEKAAGVAAVLRSWQGEHPRALWDRLAAAPPAEDLSERAGGWLWLQARSASGVPIWWDGWRAEEGTTWRDARNAKPHSTWDRFGEENAGRWSQADHGTGRTQRATQSGRGWVASDGRGDPRPAGARGLGGWEQGSAGGRDPQPAGQRGEWRMGEEKTKSKRGDRTVSQGGTSRGRTGGMVNPATIADRAEAIAAAFLPVDWEVWHGGATELASYLLEGAGAGTFAYLDPPYRGATGYGWDALREEVEGLALLFADAGAVVAISEAEPIELTGWHHVELTRPGGKPEWLTLSRKPARVPATQRSMFA